MSNADAAQDLALLAAMIEQLDTFLSRREVTRRLLVNVGGRRMPEPSGEISEEPVQTQFGWHDEPGNPAKRGGSSAAPATDARR